MDMDISAFSPPEVTSGSEQSSDLLCKAVRLNLVYASGKLQLQWTRQVCSQRRIELKPAACKAALFPSKLLDDMEEDFLHLGELRAENCAEYFSLALRLSACGPYPSKRYYFAEAAWLASQRFPECMRQR